MLRRCILSSLLLVLFGCFSMPQTAEEFRQAVPGSFSAKHQVYEVDRSYRQVADTLSAKATECFNVAVEVRSSGYGSSSHWTDYYKPTVVVGDRRTEFHLQQYKDQGNLLKPHKEPEGGYYLMVVDVEPVSRNKVSVDLYAPRVGYGHVIDAIDGWIRGTSELCPDMAEHAL